MGPGTYKAPESIRKTDIIGPKFIRPALLEKDSGDWDYFYVDQVMTKLPKRPNSSQKQDTLGFVGTPSSRKERLNSSLIEFHGNRGNETPKRSGRLGYSNGFSYRSSNNQSNLSHSRERESGAYSTLEPPVQWKAGGRPQTQEKRRNSNLNRSIDLRLKHEMELLDKQKYTPVRSGRGLMITYGRPQSQPKESNLLSKGKELKIRNYNPVKEETYSQKIISPGTSKPVSPKADKLRSNLSYQNHVKELTEIYARPSQGK